MDYTDWKTVLMPEYEIRKNKAQKTAFIDMLKGRFGDRMRVETCGSLVKSRNIVLGDPEKARVIYTAHYDTCARLPFPNFITPRNVPLFLLYQIGLALLMVVPVFGLSILAAVLTKSILATYLALILSLVGVYWVLLVGVANPHTANDNTSGVVAVLSLAERLAEREEFAFILFDNEETGLLGSTGYASLHKEIRKNTPIVNFDCVSDGPHFLVLFSKAALKLPLYEAMRASAADLFGNADGKRIPGESRKAGTGDRVCEVCSAKGSVYPSDQAAFRVSAAVCALNESKVIGLWMGRIHTPKDTVFDEGNLAALTELFSDPRIAEALSPAAGA
ncbi:MAG: M28 family peptidase [Clostridia bacterium]|nr:M28 family peptidase [Clostridia bacterium]